MTRLRPAFLAAVLMMAAAAWADAEITSASLEIRGVSLEIDTVAVTTGVDIPTTIQTKFGGKKNDEAPVVEGLLAVGDLTGPGLGSPIQLTTAPVFRALIPLAVPTPRSSARPSRFNMPHMSCARSGWRQ